MRLKIFLIFGDVAVIRYYLKHLEAEPWDMDSQLEARNQLKSIENRCIF